MKVVNNADQVIEVTKTAYDLLYKKRGFTPYVEKKKTNSNNKKTATTKKKETSASSKKKVKKDDKS